MGTTTIKETAERARRVLECLATGPKPSAEIVAATGLGIRAVINSLSGLRRAGGVTMTDPRRPGESRSWCVWAMAPKSEPAPNRPAFVEKGITADDLAWMRHWRDRAAVRAARRAA